VPQAIGCVLLRQEEFLRDCTRRIIASRRSLCLRLGAIAHAKGLTLYPSSTNFAFLRCENAPEVHRALLAESVAIRQMGPYLRITAGTEEENETGCALLERYL
jgi:histidinol-phosphate aminotransferase